VLRTVVGSICTFPLTDLAVIRHQVPNRNISKTCKRKLYPYGVDKKSCSTDKKPIISTFHPPYPSSLLFIRVTRPLSIGHACTCQVQCATIYRSGGDGETSLYRYPNIHTHDAGCDFYPRDGERDPFTHVFFSWVQIPSLGTCRQDCSRLAIKTQQPVKHVMMSLRAIAPINPTLKMVVSRSSICARIYGLIRPHNVFALGWQLYECNGSL